MKTFPRFFTYDPGREWISGDVLVHTENAVFTEDGRYFVAGQHADPDLNWGIYEVVNTASGHELHRIAAGILEVDATPYDCWFHGLTSDGTYLYATAAVHLENKPTRMDYGALFRVLPGKDTVEVSIARYDTDEVRGYNGMAVGPDGSVFMSNSYPFLGGGGEAIYKVTITDPDDFQIKITPWLPANPFRDLAPNGIQIKDNRMYYVSGKGLYQIDMTPSGPGMPIPIYWTLLLNNVLDDLVILPENRVAVAEIDFVSTMLGWPGIGSNQIITVDLNSPLLYKEIVVTSPYTISSLAYEETGSPTNDKLIATSWFHGGIREFDVSHVVR